MLIINGYLMVVEWVVHSLLSAVIVYSVNQCSHVIASFYETD